MVHCTINNKLTETDNKLISPPNILGCILFRLKTEKLAYDDFSISKTTCT